MLPLIDTKIMNLAVNVPGPVACFELAKLGAQVIKIEPPAGDPLVMDCPDWYHALSINQNAFKLDLKTEAGMKIMLNHLDSSDILLTSTRPQALERLGLGWKHLNENFPKLIQIAITGYAAPNENVPAHDLTCQARTGLLHDGQPFPRVLIADMAAAQKAVSLALAALLNRQKTGMGGYVPVAISEACECFADAYRYGVTQETGVLGGAFPGYRIYKTKDGWLAVAALEERFFNKLLVHTGKADLQNFFMSKTASEWEIWAIKEDLPIMAINRRSTTEG